MGIVLGNLGHRIVLDFWSFFSELESSFGPYDLQRRADVCKLYHVNSVFAFVPQK